MEKLNVLIVGGGGREHALANAISSSRWLGELYCAPGNGGTITYGKNCNVDIAVDQFEKLTEFALAKKIGLVVIGPDNPLAEGIVDYMEERGLKVFGPRQASARLESSKAHAKKVMTDLNIATARYEVFESKKAALDFVEKEEWARIVKVDGLALGKGVFVCNSLPEAKDALNEIFDKGTFGKSGEKVVIEERLSGEELSVFLLCDGKRALEMAPSQDHKRRFDDDKGPNTGGMGAYSPVPLYDECKDAIARDVIEPISEALKNGKLDFKGVLFIGLMICGGKPYVLEFNARFGDPETQAILPRLKSDLLEALLAAAEGRLNEVTLEWDKSYSCCVVACHDKYPESSSKGQTITIGNRDDVWVYHAGTKIVDGILTTNGGRVLAVTAVDEDPDKARAKAYEALKDISFNGMDYRKDIAWRITNKCHSK